MNGYCGKAFAAINDLCEGDDAIEAIVSVKSLS